MRISGSLLHAICLIPALIFLLIPKSQTFAAPAASQEQTRILSSDARIFLVTVGPGKLVWERFGHNGLWIQDQTRGIDRIYHWGLFSFQSENFWPKFLKGYMDYSIGSEHAQRFFQTYAADDREIRIQELNLNSDQRESLVRLLRENDKEGNRIYRYDYYLDNCSTRARDVIDTVVGGLVSKATRDKGSGESFRSHTRRLLQEMDFPYLGIQIGLGHPADDEISVWEEMFTPMALRRHLDEISLPDGSPLVLSDKLIFSSSSVTEPEKTNSFLGYYLSISGSVGVLLVILGYLTAAGKKSARSLLAFIGMLWGFLSGFVGIIFLLIWVFTEHRFGHWNENLLQFNPLSWVVAVFFLILLIRGRLPGRALTVLYTVAGFSVLGFVLQVIPAFDQVNGEIIALALPIHLGLVWSTRVFSGLAGNSFPNFVTNVKVDS